MAILDQIAKQRQRISERLMRVDAERTKLGGQLDELEIAERALNRFGGRGAAKQQPSSGPAAKPAAAARAKPAARGSKPVPGASLGEATLKAVQAHAKGAKADEVLKYLSRKFGRAAASPPCRPDRKPRSALVPRAHRLVSRPSGLRRPGDRRERSKGRIARRHHYARQMVC